MTELMMGLGVSTMMLAGLISASVTLQRSYKASEYYASASSDQVRALDYIVRDARCALSAAYNAADDSLTLRVPALYQPKVPGLPAYDTEGNPTSNAEPRVPIIYGDDVADYGTLAEQLVIVYKVVDRSLLRTVTSPGGSNSSVIATDVDFFDFDFVTDGSIVTAKLSFSPRFRGIGTSTDLKTTRSAVIYMRNLNKKDPPPPSAT
ncbi:MAG TPA: hypothetical protein VF585_04440 [Chthoniobacterales bacterium]|jgi:hypothetical protein